MIRECHLFFYRWHFRHEYICEEEEQMKKYNIKIKKMNKYSNRYYSLKWY